VSNNTDIAVLKQLAHYLYIKSAFYEKYGNKVKTEFWRQREQTLLRAITSLEAKG